MSHVFPIFKLFPWLKNLPALYLHTIIAKCKMPVFIIFLKMSWNQLSDNPWGVLDWERVQTRLRNPTSAWIKAPASSRLEKSKMTTSQWNMSFWMGSWSRRRAVKNWYKLNNNTDSSVNIIVLMFVLITIAHYVKH